MYLQNQLIILWECLLIHHNVLSFHVLTLLLFLLLLVLIFHHILAVCYINTESPQARLQDTYTGKSVSDTKTQARLQGIYGGKAVFDTRHRSVSLLCVNIAESP
jgi:hypothetical protein